MPPKQSFNSTIPATAAGEEEYVKMRAIALLQSDLLDDVVDLAKVTRKAIKAYIREQERQYGADPELLKAYQEKQHIVRVGYHLIQETPIQNQKGNSK